MEIKKVVGIVLMILAIATFFLYILFPLLNSDSKGVFWITASIYVLNKIFFYSSLYILGKPFVGRLAKYLPRKIERLLLRVLKIQPLTQINTTMPLKRKNIL